MKQLDGAQHINNFSQFLEEIRGGEGITVEYIKEKIRNHSLSWSDNEIRLLIHDDSLTPKRKFLIFLAVGELIQPGHAYWILLEYLFNQTVLTQGNSLENPSVVFSWIQRSMQKHEVGMGKQKIQEMKASVKLKFGIRENWYITQQVSRSVGSLLRGSYDDIIIMACRFLSIANDQMYLKPGSLSILKLAQLGRTEGEKYLKRYQMAQFSGIHRLTAILHHLWGIGIPPSELTTSEIISLLGLYKSV